MNLPHKWGVLRTRSNENERFLFGADYSSTSVRYSIYLTDLNHVWISDVDQEKLEFKAMQNGIQRDSLASVYETLVKAFESNFSEIDEEESETFLDLEKLKIDRGVPLEMKLKMEKSFKKNNFKWNWNFDLTILPDSSSITIMKSLIFQMSTVVFSLNEYKNDLVKQIHHKDSAIRFLSESIDSLNASHIVNKWAPENSSNQTILQKFDQRYFDTVWRNKKLEHLKDQYIWDLIDSNNTSNTWSYGTSFKSEKDPESMGSKRGMKTEQKEESPFVEAPKRTASPFKKRGVNNIENLNNDFEVYDINEMNEEVEPKRETKQKKELKPISKEISSDKSTPDPLKSPEKKKTFGVSRKRKVQYKEFSPIKAPKYFHSDD